MKSAKSNLLVPRSVLTLVALLLVLGGACIDVASARSLYVIGSITNFGNPLPIMAYDIAPDGSLAFQSRQSIPFRDGGAVGIAVDWQSEYLFVTFEYSGTISLLDARTLAEVGQAHAPNAEDLAGIVYDQSKERLYCVDRDTDKLFAYQWNPTTGKLSLDVGAPFTLEDSRAYGIALDEQRGLLYTANGTNTILVYDTTNWGLVDSITVARPAISIAVDPIRGYLYTGAGYFTDYTLNQYNLNTRQTKALQVDPEAGVMGLCVDLATGFVYVTTGKSNLPGGDDLLVFDTTLALIDSILNIGDPTGIVIPATDLGYNPLKFRKEIVTSTGLGATEDVYVSAGDMLSYRLCFDNAHTIDDVDIIDTLPEYLIFIDAEGDGDFGHYDAGTHTYTWSFSQIYAGSSTCLPLLVQVNPQTPPGTLLRNFATIDTQALPPTTVSADAQVTGDVSQALSLSKEITNGATEPDGSGRRYVEIGQEISYRLCFDNRGNTRTVDRVLVVDTLPAELAFVRADGDRDFGLYDPNTHTYTWSVDSLAPNEAMCVELVAQVRDTATPGTLIVNRAAISGDQTNVTETGAEVTVQPVDASPLGLVKRITAGTIPGADSKTLYVGIGDEIIYEICLDSRDNNLRLEQLVITDALPPEVTFVSAEGDGIFGTYDPVRHTYTWTYPSLLPGSGVCLGLVVRVRSDVAPGTTIRNTATVENRDIATQTTSVSAVAATKNVETYALTKTVTAGANGQDSQGTPYVSAGQEVTYTVCFTNNSDTPLANAAIVDTLPQDVTFVSAEGDGTYGRYDPIAHTYTWSYVMIDPGAKVCTDLTVRINDKVGIGVTIVNEVSLQAKDASAAADTKVVTGQGGGGSEPTTVPMALSPLIVGREGFNRSDQLTATLAFSAGVSPDDIPVDTVILTPGGLVANSQIVSVENGTIKVKATWDLATVLAGIPNNGITTLTVTGQLRSGRAFIGEGNILVVAVRPY